MFSSQWDFPRLNQFTQQIIEQWRTQGLIEYVPWITATNCPASRGFLEQDRILVIASGYPEWAGVWSYTLLNEHLLQGASLQATSMQDYFSKIPLKGVGVVALNPHAPTLAEPYGESFPHYYQQLQTLCEQLLAKPQRNLILYGFSLGGDVLLRFLQDHPEMISRIEKIILVDPTPPAIGRKKMHAALSTLLDTATLYGLSDENGLPGEFAELAKMRLKLKPQLFQAKLHGELPNLCLPSLLEQL